MSELHEVVEGNHRCFKLYGVSRLAAEDDWRSTLVEWLDPAPEAPADFIVQTGHSSARTRSRSAASVLSPRSIRRGRTLKHFLLELWPAAPTPPRVITERSELARDEQDTPPSMVPAPEAVGIEAAWAIIRDVRRQPGARPWNGELETLAIAHEFEGTPVNLFNRLRYAFGWPPCQGGAGGPDSDNVGGVAYHDATLPEFDGPYDSAGEIVTTMVEVTKPRTLVMRWNWILEADGPSHPDARPRVLADDSTVTMTFVKISGADQDP